MSFCRRDTARNLYQALRQGERAFIDAVTEEIVTGRIETKNERSKLGEKIIVLYYQDHDRLIRKLNEVWDFML